MSKVRKLRSLVKQRLTADEPAPGERLYSGLYDVQQLLESKEEDPPEQQQEWSPHLDQEEPAEPPHIKEEPEEVWSSQEGEQLQGLEDPDLTEFPFPPVPVKSEEDEEKPQSSQLHQRLTEQMETGADGEDCGGPGPASSSDPDPHLEPDTEDKTGVSADWRKSREPQSGSNSLRMNTAEKSFSCSECGKRFSQNSNLKTHMRIHTGEKPFSCSVCGKRFGQKVHLTHHMASQLHQRLTEQMETGGNREDCGGPEPASNSDPDTDDKTDDSSETEVSDGDWTESREPQSELNSVVNNISKTDGKSFVCSECGKAFGHKTNLKRHMRCHTGEKPFSCSFCSKSFNRREHLTAHTRCHSGEKPFSCSVCNTSFSHGWSLDKHMRVHTGEKPFSCSLCSKSFRQRSDLVAHFRIHTGEKPFFCSVCNTSFTQRHTLVQHMRTHTGHKPFICSVCGKRFSRKGHMTRHMTAHTGEKPFSCSVCGQSFTWQSQFKRHECVSESSK